MIKKIIFRNEGEKLRHGVYLMLLSLMVMMVALSSLYFLSIVVASFIGLGLYASLFYYEMRAQMRSPITALMLVFFAGLSIASLIVKDAGLFAYTAPIIYFSLAAAVWGGWLLNRPFTASYSDKKNLPALHRLLSVVWGSCFLLAGSAALLFLWIPHFLILYVAFLSMITAVGATLWIEFFNMGNAWSRAKSFDYDGFHFQQIDENDGQNRHKIYDLVANAYCADIRKFLKPPAQSVELASLMERQQQYDTRRKDMKMLRFLAFKGIQSVGSISVCLDDAQMKLPMEDESRFEMHEKLQTYRQQGRVMQVIRIALAPRYRLNPTLLEGLFKCVADIAAQKNISFMIVTTVDFHRSLFKKIGFEALQQQPFLCDQKGYHGYEMPVMPMVLNFASLVRLDDTEHSLSGTENRSLTNPYLAARFFKRLAVYDLFRMRKRVSLSW